MDTSDETSTATEPGTTGVPSSGRSPYTTGSGLLVWLPFIVLILTLAIALFFWLIFDASLKDRAANLYREKTEQISSRIVNRLNDHEQVLRGGAGLFSASRYVTREEWHRYITSLALREHHPGILGVGFSEWITPDQKESHIRSIRSQGFPDYTIRPEGNREAYTSIIYLEPFNWRNRRAFGYDMFSEKTRRTAMQRAQDEGIAALTGKVTLMQETEKDRQNGILMYLPVYRNGVAIATREERRAAILGFVYSPIRINDFIYGTLSKLPVDIAFDIYAADRETSDALLFSSSAATGRDAADDHHPDFRSTMKLDVYGTAWLISFRSLPEFSRELGRSQSYSALAGGVAVSFLLTLITQILVTAHNRAFKTAREINERKEELEASLARLKRLEGIIPICMYCKNIRSDNDTWHQLEAYISDHSEALFSHGICPQCYHDELKKLKK